MTSITWAGPSCVQELGTFLAPQNRIQGRCGLEVETDMTLDISKVSTLYGHFHQQ